MAEVVPTSIPADGSVKAVFVPTIADPTAPTVAELTGVSAVDLSCYLTADGLTNGTDEQTITDDRLCTRQSFERPGRFTDSLSLMYVYNAQEPAAADNEAYATLKHRTLGYIVQRWGADFEDPIAAGDVVDVIAVDCGVQVKQSPEANSVLKVAQRMFIRDNAQRDVVVA